VKIEKGWTCVQGNHMRDKIGNVELNLSYYSGRDEYSDGAVEDELLEIVKNNSKDFSNIIYDRASWPILYHLSEEREYLLEWYSFKKHAKVLEVGAGCGALSGCLCRKAESVKAVELSLKRSTINAYKNCECSNLEILVGNFNDIHQNLNEKFDYVTLIGVLEYAPAYIGTENSFVTFLNKVNDCLEEDGKLIIAIENRFGLKYFAGCREDHLGVPFVGIEGYYNRSTHVQTFNKAEMEKLLKDAGFEEWKFYYPYPDYKFPNNIYSDEFLPQKGELMDNIRNFDSSRLILFDETRAYDAIIEAGNFPEFSNSFLIVINKRR